MSEHAQAETPLRRYLPFDQGVWLDDPPWSPDDPALLAWEAAHGHDVRLKCYPEFGCQVVGNEYRDEAADLQRRMEAARAVHFPLMRPGGGPGCVTCTAEDWPCRTVQALDAP